MQFLRNCVDFVVGLLLLVGYIIVVILALILGLVLTAIGLVIAVPILFVSIVCVLWISAEVEEAKQEQDDDLWRNCKVNDEKLLAQPSETTRKTKESGEAPETTS